MRILIIDDIDISIDYIKNLFCNLKKEITINLHITILTKPEFNKIRSFITFDLLAINVDAEKFDSIKLSYLIRKIDNDIKIFLYSESSLYLINTYKVYPNLYLMKPIKQSVFNYEMRKLLYQYIYGTMGYTNKNISPTKIYFKDLLYIEIVNRKSVLHFISKEPIEYHFPLIKWKEILSEAPFGQSHRAYLINFQFILSIQRNNILLYNSLSIPLSKVYNKQFRAAYNQYLQNINFI